MDNASQTCSISQFHDIDIREIKVNGKDQEVIKFNLPNIRKYLDNTIRYWDRKLREERSAQKKTQCSAFIQGYQTMRLALFGEKLLLNGSRNILGNKNK